MLQMSYTAFVKETGVNWQLKHTYKALSVCYYDIRRTTNIQLTKVKGF